MNQQNKERYDQHLRKTGGKHGDFKITPDPPQQPQHDFMAHHDLSSFFTGNSFFDFEDLLSIY